MKSKEKRPHTKSFLLSDRELKQFRDNVAKTPLTEGDYLRRLCTMSQLPEDVPCTENIERQNVAVDILSTNQHLVQSLARRLTGQDAELAKRLIEVYERFQYMFAGSGSA